MISKIGFGWIQIGEWNYSIPYILIMVAYFITALEVNSVENQQTELQIKLFNKILLKLDKLK